MSSKVEVHQEVVTLSTITIKEGATIQDVYRELGEMPGGYTLHAVNAVVGEGENDISLVFRRASKVS